MVVKPIAIYMVDMVTSSGLHDEPVHLHFPAFDFSNCINEPGELIQTPCIPCYQLIILIINKCLVVFSYFDCSHASVSTYRSNCRKPATIDRPRRI